MRPIAQAIPKTPAGKSQSSSDVWCDATSTAAVPAAIASSPANACSRGA